MADTNASPNLSAEETAWLLMERVNYLLAATFGPDFELGEAYILGITKEVSDDAKYRFLARVWDQRIYPLLQERFAGRPNELEVLIPRNAPSVTLIKTRAIPRKLDSAAEPAAVVSQLEAALSDDPNAVRETLWFLARG